MRHSLWAQISCILAFSAVAVPGFAQAEPGADGLAKAPRERVAASQAPVTEREAKLALHRVEQALRQVVLNQTAGTAAPSADPNRPYTRVQFINELDRLFRLCRPRFRFTPRMSRVDRPVITIPTEDPARQMVENLIAWGFVGRVVPLVTSNTETMRPEEFGDLLGFFVARVADLTHTPSSRWSPYLMKD